jgi:hypothetical protein
MDRIGPPRSTRAHNDGVVAATMAGRPPSVARPTQFGFVCSNGLASAAHRRCRTGVHSQPDPVTKEPSGLHAAIKHALDLPGRDAFLAGAKQMDDLQPQMQRQVAILKNRPHADCEGLLAGVALVQARTRRLAVQAANAPRLAAVRANGAVRPQARLDVSEGCGLILKMRGRKYGLGHGEISNGRNTKSWAWYVKCNAAQV